MKRLAALALLLLLGACARTADGPGIAAQGGWHWRTIPAGTFTLATASNPQASSDTLTVYIEGDGFAYVHADQPSNDPTPTDPVALRLAMADPAAAKHPVAWIARPCQYVMSAACQTDYWTTGRFAPEAIDSLNQGVDALKAAAGAKRLYLVGYSGGGAVAVLLAARRQDVAGIVTVAGLLDVGYWTSRDGYTPLTGLDPASVAGQLGHLPQVHFSGSDDHTVGTDVTQSFTARLPAGTPATIKEIPDFTHSCCWADHWPELARQVPFWTSSP